MRRMFTQLFTIALGLALVAPPALAEIVSVRFNGLITYSVLDMYRDDTHLGQKHAAQFKLIIDDQEVPTFCMDIDTDVVLDQWYEAEAYPLPTTSPWCEIGYILSTYEAVDNHTGAVMQLAMWKLIDDHAEVPATVWATDAQVELGASELAEEADGRCSLACSEAPTVSVTLEPTEDGLLAGQVVVTSDGAPVHGVEVALAISAGALVAPADVLALTDDEGVVEVLIDPEGGVDLVTLTATVEGTDITILEPLIESQMTASLMLGDGCTYEASAEAAPVTEDELGDPHTIGFWKHQFKLAACHQPPPCQEVCAGKQGCKKNKCMKKCQKMSKKRHKKCKGHAQVPADVLAGYLPVEVLGAVTIETLEEGRAALWIKQAPMKERAVQQCFATELNAAAGEVGPMTPLDLDGDGASDGYFYELMDEAEAAYAAGDYETAKTICDDINNL